MKAGLTLAVMARPSNKSPFDLLRLVLLLPALAILSVIGLPSPYGVIAAVLAVALLAACLYVG